MSARPGTAGATRTCPHCKATILESAENHNSQSIAQTVPIPVAINGRITQSGDIDFYAFEVTKEEELCFEIVRFQGNGFDPQLALYDSVGSWLDPNRTNRLLFNEEVSLGTQPLDRRKPGLAQRVEGAGQQHRHRPGPSHRVDPVLAEPFQMVGRQRPAPRR